jgi:hypothetical protein
MAQLTEQRRIAFKVILFPESFQFQDEHPNRDPQRAWLALCADLKLDCLDLWQDFALAADGPARRLFNGVQHPNAAGTLVAARAVAASLVDDWSAGGGAGAASIR